MPHVLFGTLTIVASVWMFVDVLNAGDGSRRRIRLASLMVAVFMWLTCLAGGDWYVRYYAPDKALILEGPWPFSHSFFMETKEHVVLILLLLCTYLPIVAATDLARNRRARTLALWVAGLIAAIGLAADGSGAMIGAGARLALMSR